MKLNTVILNGHGKQADLHLGKKTFLDLSAIVCYIVSVNIRTQEFFYATIRPSGTLHLHEPLLLCLSTDLSLPLSLITGKSGIKYIYANKKNIMFRLVLEAALFLVRGFLHVSYLHCFFVFLF